MQQRCVCLAGIVFLASFTVGQAGEGFVRRDGAKLTLDGREYRAIGMNCPDLFASYSGIFYHLQQCFGTEEAAKQAMFAAVQEAEKNRIAFLRFYASGFWPKDMRLYFDAPEQYWARMDELVTLCRTHHVRLVPSIFFHIYLWPMICGEDYQAIADPHSNTYRAMHKYASELVSRYRDDTNILAWELSNEVFLAADVNMAGRDSPAPQTMLSATTKTKLTVNDSLSTATILKFYGDMTAHIRRIDPNHLVTSGDAGPRTTSVSLRENFPTTVWTQDTLRQNLASLLTSQSEPLDLVSLHHYGSLTKNDERENLGLTNSLEALRCRIRCSHAARSPVFIGELGNTEPTLRDDREAGYVRAAIDVIEAEGVSLAAVWAWHLRLDPIHNVTAESHPPLMKRIAECNGKYATFAARP